MNDILCPETLVQTEALAFVPTFLTNNIIVYIIILIDATFT